MSGCPASKITILAALLVVPPDLMAPADESAPRMNETGPDAIPPPERDSLEERRGERLMPEPEPPLKIMPSVLIHSMMDSMLSLIERIKHAEHCGGFLTPTLNQTGELNAAR